MPGLEKTANTRAGALAYAKHVPAGGLATFVDHVRVVPPSTHDTSYVRLPDGQMELVLRGGAGADPDWLNLVGTRSTALRKESGPQGALCVVVRFKVAGGYPFFGLPVSELTDRLVPLDLLWGTESARLQDALHGSRTAQLLGLIEGALQARLRGAELYEPALATRVRRGVRWLDGLRVLPSVEELADELGASARQLRRAFAEVVGVAPKQYLRIVRFQRVRRLLRGGAATQWSALASAAGYFDQAHMINEFRALCGETPAAAYAAGMLGGVREAAGR